MRAAGGFTLIELVAVIAIIGVLATITFNVALGVRSRARLGKARVEIAALAQALEAYKLQYGDYPQTGSAAEMLRSLIGRRGPLGATITGRPLIETVRFATVDGEDPFTSASAELVDPFGQPYRYAYKTGGTWRNPGFVLCSAGPDGGVAGTLPADGIITDTFLSAYNSSTRTGNPDNIYHGRD